MTKIVLKNGSGVPEPTALDKAELALDINNGALYSKLEDGDVHQLNDFSGSGGGGDSLWEQNGSDIYYDSGNVSVGTDAGTWQFTVGGNTNTVADILSTSDTGNSQLRFSSPSSDGAGKVSYAHDTDVMTFQTAAQTRLTIDSTGDATFSGNVGIGTSNIDETLVLQGSMKLRGSNSIWFTNTSGLVGLSSKSSARITLSNDNTNGSVALKTNGEERLLVDENGDATFSGILNATWYQSAMHGHGFSTYYEDAIVPYKNGTTYAGKIDIGRAGFEFKDAHFTGTVKGAILQAVSGNSAIALQIKGSTQSLYARPNGAIWRDGAGGIAFTSGGHIKPVDGAGTDTDATNDLGVSTVKFKDAHFSGTVNAEDVVCDRVRSGVVNRAGFHFGGSALILPCDHQGNLTDGVAPLGRVTNRFKDAYFSGTVNSADGYFSGKVGIGMTPAMRLRSWKEAFDARMKAEPKANKKAVLREITDDAFGVMPTEEIVAEWMESRAAGDALQVNGDGSFSGTVNAITFERPNVCGFGFSVNANSEKYVYGVINGAVADSQVNLGDPTIKWKDAHLSGIVNAGAFVGDGSGLTNLPTGGGGPTYSAGNGISLNNDEIAMTGSYSGNFSASGTITGTDCIATSDERLKDNITTAPVGLIDHLKGREWDWLETREKGSGVVAQELEKVLPHLVHEDDEGMKAVSYNGLVAYLIEEVKALKAEVEELRNG